MRKNQYHEGMVGIKTFMLRQLSVSSVLLGMAALLVLGANLTAHHSILTLLSQEPHSQIALATPTAPPWST